MAAGNSILSLWSFSSHPYPEMGSMRERVRILVQEIREDPYDLVKLREFSTLLSSCQPGSAESLLTGVDIDIIFGNLNSTDSEVLEATQQLLNNIFSNVPIAAVLRGYQSQLVNGLESVSIVGQSFILKQISVGAQDENARDVLLSNPAILQAITKILGMEDLTIATYSSSILVDLAKDKRNLDRLLTFAVTEVLNDLLTRNSVIRFRVLETAVRIACHSQSAFSKILQYPYLRELSSDFMGNDILVKMNCLELLSDLATTEYGLQYLDKEGVIKMLETILVDPASEPFAGILINGIMKFFGTIGYLSPVKLNQDHPSVMGVIFQLLSDPGARSIAIDTIAMIATSAKGKRVLETHEESMTSYLKVLGQLLQHSQTEVRVRTIEAIAKIMKIEDENADAEIYALTEKWYKLLCEKPTEILFGISQQPFVEIRCAALNTVLSIAKQPWGEAEIVNYPGFLEFLLNRSTEQTKEGKESKYAIVKTLAKSSTLKNVTGTEMILRLKEYVNLGPFYVSTEASVAFEGAD